MPLTPGTRLGPYEVVALLGVGGMGEVYRARDTKLNRDVAVKILPDAFAADPERFARFTREAQTLAALNHPHIAHVYGRENVAGQAGQEARAGSALSFIVMELVEGEDLAQLISRGRIPIEESLVIARQIADAMATAHEQGIIHRDLKPANVKVRPDGTVKVLDFGLAKPGVGVGGASGEALANSPTITSPAAMTAAGVILGTAAYMSPEQAKGRVADKRSDIWAFAALSSRCSPRNARSRARIYRTRSPLSCARSRIGARCRPVPLLQSVRSSDPASRRIGGNGSAIFPPLCSCSTISHS